jgi:hypothetical protein
VQIEPEGSIRAGSVRTFLTEIKRFEPEKGFTYFHIYSPLHTSSALIFLAEADRLEAGGFNLVIDIKSEKNGNDRLLHLRNCNSLESGSY